MWSKTIISTFGNYYSPAPVDCIEKYLYYLNNKTGNRGGEIKVPSLSDL